jgi:hypothetical protein
VYERVASGQQNEDARLHAKKRVREGTHNFLGENNPMKKASKNGTHHFFGGDIQKKTQQKLVVDGTHHWLRGEIQRQTQLKNVSNGTHHLLGNSQNLKMLENGTHPSQSKWTCEFCKKSGTGVGNYTRWHGTQCRINAAPIIEDR